MHDRPISEGRRRPQRGHPLVEVSVILLPLLATPLALIGFSLALFLRVTRRSEAHDGGVVFE